MPVASFPRDFGRFEESATPSRMSLTRCVGFRTRFGRSSGSLEVSLSEWGSIGTGACEISVTEGWIRGVEIDEEVLGGTRVPGKSGFVLINPTLFSPSKRDADVLST